MDWPMLPTLSQTLWSCLPEKCGDHTLGVVLGIKSPVGYLSRPPWVEELFRIR